MLGPLAVVDDLGHPTACDIAVNPRRAGKPSHPTAPPGLLAVPRTRCCRPAVVAARGATSGPSREGRRTVLVTTGAMDPQGGDAACRRTAAGHSTQPSRWWPSWARKQLNARAPPRGIRVCGVVVVEPSTLAGTLAMATVYAGSADIYRGPGGVRRSARRHHRHGGQPAGAGSRAGRRQAARSSPSPGGWSTTAPEPARRRAPPRLPGRATSAGARSMARAPRA